MQVNAKIYDLVHNEGDDTETGCQKRDELELIAGNVNELLAYIRKIMIGISSGSMRLMSSSRKMVDHLSSADESITDVGNDAGDECGDGGNDFFTQSDHGGN